VTVAVKCTGREGGREGRRRVRKAHRSSNGGQVVEEEVKEGGGLRAFPKTLEVLSLGELEGSPMPDVFIALAGREESSNSSQVLSYNV
jgi:hypothetical protein